MNTPIKKRAYLCQKTGLLLFSWILLGNIVLAQVPTSVETEYDRFNIEMVKAYSIILEENEAMVLKKLASMKPELYKKAESLSKTIESYEDKVSEGEIAAFEKKVKQKSYFKEMMDIFSNERFSNKLLNSQALKQEVEELNSIMELAFSDKNKDYEGSSNSNLAATFTFGENSIYKREIFRIRSNFEDKAVGYVDDLGNLNFSIMGNSDGKEVIISFFIEGDKAGKFEWATEGNMVIEVYSEDGNQELSFWGNEENGYIQVNKIEPLGGYITGKFSGRFSDDMEYREELIPISGTFKVKHTKEQY